MKFVVMYDSNNSGGRWWLSDEDWQKLAEAGWNVHWVQPGGRRSAESYEDPMKPQEFHGNRWLNAQAMSCAKVFEEPMKGIEEFEQITGQNAGEIGCTCCGPPHSFEAVDENGKSHYAHAQIVYSDISFGGLDD